MSVAVILAMASGPSLQAGTRKASRTDAPRQLGEALATGTADVETIASIVRWVLEEEPEKIAPALASVLQAAIDQSPGGGDARATAAARSAVGLFASLLDDARAHRRRDEASVARDAANLAREVWPGVAEALAEVLHRPSPPPPR